MINFFCFTPSHGKYHLIAFHLFTAQTLHLVSPPEVGSWSKCTDPNPFFTAQPCNLGLFEACSWPKQASVALVNLPLERGGEKFTLLINVKSQFDYQNYCRRLPSSIGPLRSAPRF